MKNYFERIESVFAAVSFAEQGEWEDAVKMAEGSNIGVSADGKQIKKQKKNKKQSADKRPQVLL